MGSIEDAIRCYLRENYPEVAVREDAANFYARGRFVINAQFESTIVDWAPKLLIIIPKNYPDFMPMAYELDGIVQSDHKLSDGALCVSTEFDMVLGLCSSTTIGDYFDEFLIPYFISYKSWKETKSHIFGDRSHGLKGIYESIGAYFNVSPDERMYIQKLLQWSSRSSKFARIFAVGNRAHMKSSYDARVARLRCSGTHNLRRVYKNLLALHEYEKHYFNYQKRLAQLDSSRMEQQEQGSAH